MPSGRARERASPLAPLYHCPLDGFENNAFHRVPRGYVFVRNDLVAHAKLLVRVLGRVQLEALRKGGCESHDQPASGADTAHRNALELRLANGNYKHGPAEPVHILAQLCRDVQRGVLLGA